MEQVQFIICKPTNLSGMPKVDPLMVVPLILKYNARENYHSFYKDELFREFGFAFISDHFVLRTRD